jgi:hypothetical protein
MKRILIVGCPRSGTTLLQSMLGTHADLLTFTESHFFPTYFLPRRKRRLFAYVRPELPARIAAFLAENGCEPRLQPHVRTGRMLSRSFVVQAQCCLAMFDAMAVGRGKQAWLEKTPDNLHRLELLESASPGLRTIHIIREPLPTIRSLSKASQAWTTPLNLAAAADKWRRDVRASLHYLGRVDHLFVLYEDLVQRPESIVATLFVRLGLSLDGYDLSDYASVAESVIGPGEWWKANNTRALGSVADENSETSRIDADLGQACVRVYDAAKAALRDALTQVPINDR